ncbi:MAG: BTAD domain-containing putative transcriptional regulator [Chloroflexi bacterium]|nr:BTAD domain-containing putative transcriptional regulator [Chloroflexota bacterium]
MPASRPERGDGPANRRRPALHVTLFGEFELTEDGVPRHLGKGARRIVTLLALNRGGLSRARAAAHLTPHLEPESARGSLRMELRRLRDRAPAELVEDDGTTLRLAPHVTVDAEEVEALVARVARQPDLLPDQAVTELLTRELLPDWDDDWLVPERARFRDRGLNALDEGARALAVHGDRDAALATVHRVLHSDRLRESTVAVLIEILFEQGNQAQVASTYLDFRKHLKSELGIEPSPQLRALVSRLLEGR